MVKVIVKDNNIGQALVKLKKAVQKEGIFNEIRDRQFYTKPSELKRRAKAGAIKRARRQERQRLEEEGF